MEIEEPTGRTMRALSTKAVLRVSRTCSGSAVRPIMATRFPPPRPYVAEPVPLGDRGHRGRGSLGAATAAVTFTSHAGGARALRKPSE